LAAIQAGPASVQVGPLTIASPCIPDVVAQDVGLILGCSAAIRNGSKSPVYVQAALQSQPAGSCGCPGHSGTAVSASVTVSETLAPGHLLQLPAPPAGQEWVVVYATQRTLEDVGVAVLGAVAVGLGLAGVGLWDVLRHLFGGRRQTNKRR